MGRSDMDKTSKEKEAMTPPATTSSQEQSPVAAPGTVNQEWSGFQAYSPMPPRGFFGSNPQAHPYMWGVQHIMPPYGAPPPPYVAMYPHGCVYAHPSIPPGSFPFSPFTMPSPNGIPDTPGNATGGIEADGKSSDVKEKLPIKRSKGSLGSLNMITGNNNDTGKTSGASANGVCSKSVESESEGTSEGSDANSQNDSQMKSGGRQDSLEGVASQNGNSVRGSQNGGHSLGNQPMAIVPISAGGAPGAVSGPATNLNIGMDYWGAPTSSTIPVMHGKVPSTPIAGATVAAGSREIIQSQLWLQDERELKRHRRKQSNRESARRSRLRKQAECDELAHHAEALEEENASLRSEMNQIRTKYKQLLAVNASLKGRIGEMPGHQDLRSGGTIGTQARIHSYDEQTEPSLGGS